MAINPKRFNLSVGMEKYNLEEQDPENDTEKFGRCSLGCTAIIQMMKCDQQGGIAYNFI